MNGLYRDMREVLTGSMDSGEARAVALLLLEKTCGLSTAEVLAGHDAAVPTDRHEEVMDMARRVAKGEPVQYVLGEADFCGLTLHVAPGVLIPRPETEELVRWVMEAPGSQEHTGRPRLLDVGTGSGCIAIALAHLLPEAEVEAWDVSEEALQVARKNAERCGVSVCFRRVDVLEDADCEMNRGEHNESFDTIVSNPPYICEEEAREMEANVLAHEPRLALFVPDDDPLLFYRRIATIALSRLKPQGRLFFEINRRFGHDTVQMLEQMGYTGVELRQDQFGNDRMVMAIKP